MLEIAGGIILAVLFLVFLPYIIAGAVLLAGSALALAVVAAVLGFAYYLLEAAGVDWSLVGQFIGIAFRVVFLVWLALVAVAVVLAILARLGVFNHAPELKKKVLKFIDVVTFEDSTKDKAKVEPTT